MYIFRKKRTADDCYIDVDDDKKDEHNRATTKTMTQMVY